LLGDSSKFPDEWLFKHRWGKGKKDASTTLPNGAKITFLTVGGRTSCIVPSVQKKSGAVAGDLKEPAGEVQNSVKGSDGARENRVNGTSKKRKAAEAELVPSKEPNEGAKKSRAGVPSTSTKASLKSIKAEDDVESPRAGRRRSGRILKRET